ncbi:hypothetical protein LSCM1_03525 [Leishmania martiniquensis]|uniref:Frag1/DRAM/Sfk1 family protein n=1 Tax=Leishmania martiniquensis TaxID=1580590 RepID=A0A836GI03_9TRYP|nr:hypothetical protein LSCM1_03525 [Leishmania martiniquensis]
MRHVFYISSSYAALIYALMVGSALLACLYIGLVSHSKVILSTSCGEEHYEFWPSISSTIGDMMPERQTWRAAFAFFIPFRIGATISFFNVFWQKASRGMADLYSFRSSWRAFLSSSAFLALLMLWVDTWRIIAAAQCTYVASSESLAYHNVGFCPYILLCFVLQVLATTLVRRNRFNMAIYPTQQDATISYALKRTFLFGESAAAVGVICFYAYHYHTCANGSYSATSIFEWIFVMCNILFDGSAWFDLKQEGWWLSGPPSFYRKRWARHANSGGSAMSSPRTNGAKDGSRDGRDGGDSDATAKLPVPLGDGNSMMECDYDGSAEEMGSLAYPPRITTGEFFLDHDVILHRFSFCSAPSQLSLWICDVYWAHMFFEMALHLVQHMFFMLLNAMSLSWELCSVLVFGAPCLLRIAAFRRWATGPCIFARSWLKPSHVPIGLSYRTVPMYILFYALALLSHFHQLIARNAGMKILVSSAGPLFLSLALFTRFLYPSTVTLKRAWSEGNEDSRRIMMTLPLGLVLCMLLRVQHAGVSPFVTDPFYGGVYGILLGTLFTSIIYRHAMMGNAVREEAHQQHSAPSVAPLMRGSLRDSEAEDSRDFSTDAGSSVRDASSTDRSGRRIEEGVSMHGVHFSVSQIDEVSENTVSAIATLYTPPSQVLLGILCGSITCLGVTFFHSANYIPRLLAIEPFPASVVVAAVFTAGLHYSTDVLPLALVLLRPRRRPDVVRRTLHTVLGGSWGRFGALLAVSTTLMLFATRQTNFTYELPHEGYPTKMDSPRSMANLKYWETQETFWGSKHLAFMGGLGFTFCIGVLFPFVMEVTWAHQRDYRFAQIAEAMDADAVISRECTFFTSFEFSWMMSTVGLGILYALCICYPFVPMAWLVREKSRPLIVAHVGTLYATAWIVARRIRASRAVAAALADVAAARKQRSIQLMVVFLILFAFAWAIVGRVTLSSANATLPANKKTAIQYQEEVLHLHKMLVELQKKRNAITDPHMPKFEVDYHRRHFEDAMNKIGRNITESKNGVPVDPKLRLAHLSYEDRLDVWEAAKAMSFFSGAIWTVRFGLDNYNVDSFARMVEQLRKINVGVIGLLESDTMHATYGNRDMVDYISYHLGFHYTDYGPTSLDNTFGCALITRYPILYVRRYAIPSPLGEVACLIHAKLDVYGLPIHTYVGHFGNTEHWADGLLQSQFLGRLVRSNPGPSIWLGYLVTHPGLKERYREYTDPTAPGKFRDAGLEMYRHRLWTRLWERGGYEEELPVTTGQSAGKREFNIELKLEYVGYLEEGMQVDSRFRSTPPGKPPRHFYYNDTGRYARSHPRYEFLDRYCQYCLFKTGATADEAAADKDKLQPYQLRLFDWWRVTDPQAEILSDTEIQVMQLAFEKRT